MGVANIFSNKYLLSGDLAYEWIINDYYLFSARIVELANFFSYPKDAILLYTRKVERIYSNYSGTSQPAICGLNYLMADVLFFRNNIFLNKLRKTMTKLKLSILKKKKKI